MFSARFFNGPELGTGQSLLATGMSISGTGAALCTASMFMAMIPAGITQAAAAWGFTFGFSFIMTGFALSAIGMAVCGLSAAKDLLTGPSDHNRHYGGSVYNV